MCPVIQLAHTPAMPRMPKTRRLPEPRPKEDRRAPSVQHDLKQLGKDAVLLVAGIGLIMFGHWLKVWADPRLDEDQQRIVRALGILGDLYVAIRLVGPNAFAIAEALVIRIADLLVLIGHSSKRVRVAFRRTSDD